MSATSARSTLRKELYEWLASLPGWQQDLARRLTQTTQLDADELDEALRMVLSEHGALAEGATCPAPQPLELDDLSGPSDDHGGARLVRVAHLRGVGMIAPDQELEFAETGLTIIYGPNAAGKSTYVSALKRVCRTVDCDASVRGNVFAAGAQDRPTATVEYIHGGNRRAQQINLNDPQDIGLGALSVFDARCAELYLTARNDIAFVPTSLAVLARLAATQDALRREIDREIATLERGRPDFREMEQSTEVKRRVEVVSATTDLDDLRVLASLSADDQQRKSEVEGVLASAASRNATADAQAAEQDAQSVEDTLARATELADRVSEEQVARISNEAAELANAREAVERAATEFEGLGRPGIGSDPWQRMWTAAREFVESTGGGFPPGEGEFCPVCLQRLDSQGAARLEHFERHVRSSLQAQVEAVEAQLARSLETVDSDQVGDLGVALADRLAEQEPEAARSLSAYVDALRSRMAGVRDGAPGTPSLPELPRAALNRWARARSEHAETLRAAADPEGEQSLRAELAELQGRAHLATRMAEVEAWVETLRRVAALRRAHSALATNRITTRQRELSTRAVTEELDRALRDELRQLSCEHLPIDLHPHTAHGTTEVTLRLAGAHGQPRVAEILSEGEQRALALGFFFAETRLAEEPSGIIVDDPVSSLDDERRSYIARRLVREARDRQTVVLTHDLPFMLDLLEQAEKAALEPKIQGVWRYGDSVGRVDRKPPFSAMKFNQRVHELEERVAHWDEQPPPRDADEAWHRVCDFYADMRNTWERAVEERLFLGVVQRFQREVKTQTLPQVTITPDLVQAIDDGITRCSFFVHDAPAGTRTSLPGRVQMRDDVTKLREFERLRRAS